MEKKEIPPDPRQINEQELESVSGGIVPRAIQKDESSSSIPVHPPENKPSDTIPAIYPNILLAKHPEG